MTDFIHCVGCHAVFDTDFISYMLAHGVGCCCCAHESWLTGRDLKAKCLADWKAKG